MKHCYNFNIIIIFLINNILTYIIFKYFSYYYYYWIRYKFNFFIKLIISNFFEMNFYIVWIEIWMSNRIMYQNWNFPLIYFIYSKFEYK